MRPSLSEAVPARIRPETLNSASTETTVAAAAGVMPSIFCAMGEAWEMFIMPATAPQVIMTIIR